MSCSGTPWFAPRPVADRRCSEIAARRHSSNSAQARNAQGAKKAAPAPTRNGRPDLQGLWSFATVTPLQRPKDLADKAVLTPEEAATLEEQAVRDRFVDQPPPPGDPGAYNRFWFDSGTEVVGTRRTSLVIDPPDGRIPPLTPHGTQREDARAAKRKIAAGPEDLPPWDRCIMPRVSRLRDASGRQVQSLVGPPDTNGTAAAKTPRF